MLFCLFFSLWVVDVMKDWFGYTAFPLTCVNFVIPVSSMYLNQWLDVVSVKELKALLYWPLLATSLYFSLSLYVKWFTVVGMHVKRKVTP